MEKLFKELPEVFGPFKTNIRVPEYTSVPATEKILKIIDTREMQRLRMIRQLGMVDSDYLLLEELFSEGSTPAS